MRLAVFLVSLAVGFAVPRGLFSALLPTLAGFAYFVVLETTRRATLGKMLVDLEVSDASGGPISVGSSAIRNSWMLLGLNGGLIGVVLEVGAALAIAATISTDPRNRGFHDRLAKTVVE